MLAILSTHPIQYQVPIWRGLAERGDVPFKVFYLSDQGLAARFDPGFGRQVAWDIDLLSGYPYEFLDVPTGSKQEDFDWLALDRDFGGRLRAQGFTRLWVQGWQVKAYWQAVRQARAAGLEVWLRGESNLRSNRGGVVQELKWLVLRRFLDRVDRFMTIGSANREFYRRLGYPESRMIAAPYCVENARFARQAEVERPNREQLRSEWGIPTDAFCFLSVGKFVRKKRPLDLAEASRRLLSANPARPVHLLWVGSGELRDELQNACSVRYMPETGLQAGTGADPRPAASFAGFLNQSEIARAYVAADSLVLPSDAKETWGLVVNEAMASGLPCVVSADCGCSDDLVLPFRPDLSFPTGDLDALARALASVMRDPPCPSSLRTEIASYDVSRTVSAAAELYRLGA